MGNKYRRGEIYWISPGHGTGSEQLGDRPGIIVSNNLNNKYSRTLEVVMLTGRRKKSLPTHVRINSALRPSTALCEQITTVAKERVDRYIGTVTRREQAAIDKAMRVSISI